MKPGLLVRADAAVPESLKSLRAAIYVRVSTADQNCELQIRDLHDYATQREWVVVDVYQDVMSGAKFHRPALTALMNDARARKFDCLLVWKLDRFGRSLVDCLNRIRDLETNSVRFIAITQGLDTNERNPVSRLLLHVLGAAAVANPGALPGWPEAVLRRFPTRRGRPHGA